MTTTAVAEPGWNARLATGLEHEERVRAELERRGWTTSPYGQGVLDEQVRRALKLTDSPRRFDPDFIVAQGSTVCGIDAKATMRGDAAHTYTISRKVLEAHLRIWANDDLAIYYVFSNLGVATPHEVMQFCHVTRIGEVNGSYVSFAAGAPRPFDEVFGPPADLSAAVRLRPDLPVGIRRNGRVD